MSKNKSQASRTALLVLIGVCLTFVLFRLGEFAYDHVPPYSEGQCFKIENSANPLFALLQFKVLKNHILEGQSDLTMTLKGLGVTSVASAVSFAELRQVEATKEGCVNE